ncbi:MAG: hypothetical protein E7299_06560 [Lachnospiraceae bacterium]|nr:hypothetical protein [Lachnospiraceae bacterium]
MRNITQEEKSAIRNMVLNGVGGVLFQMPNYDSKKKVRSMITNAAAWGDLGHFLGHGITFGGIFHQINREANWQNLARQVYERGISKGLRCFKWNPRLKNVHNEEQVVIAGSTYFSVYMRGETYRKEIYFKRIVKLEYFPNQGLEIIFKGSKDEYWSMQIYSIFDNMIYLMETILHYTLRAHYDPIYGDLQERPVSVRRVTANPTTAVKPVTSSPQSVSTQNVPKSVQEKPMPVVPQKSKRSELIGLLAK